MAALICIKIVRGTFCQLVNIANSFLRIFSNLEASITFIFPGGAGYPYLPTQLDGEKGKRHSLPYIQASRGVCGMERGGLEDVRKDKIGKCHQKTRENRSKLSDGEWDGQRGRIEMSDGEWDGQRG